jgi:hypothetical protein
MRRNVRAKKEQVYVKVTLAYYITMRQAVTHFRRNVRQWRQKDGRGHGHMRLVEVI